MNFNSIEDLKEYYEKKLKDVYEQLDFTKDKLIDVLNEKYKLELELKNKQGDGKMTTYNPFDIVELKEKTEIKNCLYLDKGIKGVVNVNFY